MLNRPVESRKFALKPIVAAVALATGAGVVVAAPTPNQMPGAGVVTAVSLGSVVPVGAPAINLVSGAVLGIDGQVVIQWGGPGAPAGEVTNPHGFNLGANATLSFSALSGNSSVLNIDASGNPSQIYGLLASTKLFGFEPSMFHRP